MQTDWSSGQCGRQELPAQGGGCGGVGGWERQKAWATGSADKLCPEEPGALPLAVLCFLTLSGTSGQAGAPNYGIGHSWFSQVYLSME